MIIGNGLIAKSFVQEFGDDPNVIIFASGVSNSREINSDAFLREKQMLIEALSQKKMLVYFSTCSVDDPELITTPYVINKMEMETLVRSAKDFAIFRLPQVVGKTPNPNTLTNFLNKKIISCEPFQVWRHATRNLIDVDDVAAIVTYLIRSSVTSGITINIACPYSVTVPQLVKIFELVLNKKASYTEVEAGGTYMIDASLATKVAREIGIDFDDAYVEKLIRKYYG
jgi:nucleoside-diphosphate-sugar epimerase